MSDSKSSLHPAGSQQIVVIMVVKLGGEYEGGGGSSKRWIRIPPAASPPPAPALLHICTLLRCSAALHCTAIQVDVTPGLLVNMPSQCNLLPLHRHRPERYIAS